MGEAQVVGLLSAAVASGTLLFLAALGELVAERSGVLNLGVEGMLAIGAAVGFIVGTTTSDPWMGLLAAMVAGAALAAVHGFVTVGLGADQVVSGLALTILGLGLAAFVGRSYVGRPPTAVFAPVRLGPLSDLPIVGPVLFAQPAVVYLAGVALVVVWFVLARTHLGLALRAAGEAPAAADTVGLRVGALRFGAVTFGGAMAGMGGGYLSLALAPSWSDNLTAGRGWIAVALVIFGAWHPLRTALGALLFGGIEAAVFRLQLLDVAVSPFLLRTLPYLFTIGVLVLVSVRGRHRPSSAPAALGMAYRREERA